MKTALGSDLSDPALSRADNRTATSVRMVPLAAVRFLVASVGFASGSCRSPVAAFWKPSYKVIPTRQRSFITVGSVPVDFRANLTPLS
jgi:hypothetical protein